jgi:ABC-2 type transport system ATP-binding protein
MTRIAVQALDLAKRFSNVQAVGGVDLEIARGEVFGLLGPNGAGKTTTLSMLEGLVTPDRGTIEITGLNWRTHGDQIRTRIGAQFQSTTLDEKITPREALTLSASYYPKSANIQALIKLVQLEEKADAFHATLSGGQQQRLALALALVNEPEVVFLDEPTTGLDPQARHGLWEVVRHLKQEGRTVVLTTHYMEEAEALCDRIAILDHGKVLQMGTPAELIHSLGIPSVVELTFENQRADAHLFAERLGFAVESKGKQWAIPVADPKSHLLHILECADAMALPFKQVHMRRASLDDVFLQRTGRSLRE